MAELPLNYPGESLLDQCAICLEKCENKSFPQYCLHGFCFACLLQWSRVKPVCPLCLKPFSSVIHNVKSNQEHDKFNIDPLWQEVLSLEEHTSSYIEQRLRQIAAAYFGTQSWMESSSDESSSDTSSESSWVTINTDDSDSEDDLFTLHEIFSHRLETMDAILAASHDDSATFLPGLFRRWLQDDSSSDEDSVNMDSEVTPTL